MIFRFANIFKLNNVNVDYILNAVKIIKSETFLSLSCDDSLKQREIGGFLPLLSKNDTLSQVLAVEENLGIESSEQIIETLTKKELQTAANMFLYLNTCPDLSFKFWFSFYKDLFLTQSFDQIILTLNRMMKATDTLGEGGNIRAEKLLKEIFNKLSLRHEGVQSLARREGATINSGNM